MRPRASEITGLKSRGRNRASARKRLAVSRERANTLEDPHRAVAKDQGVVAHRLHAARNQQACSPRADALGGGGDGLESRAAVALYRHRWRALRQVRPQRHHAGNVGGVDGVAGATENHLVDTLWIEIGCVQQLHNSLAAQLDRRHVAQRAADLGEDRAQPMRNDNVGPPGLQRGRAHQPRPLFTPPLFMTLLTPLSTSRSLPSGHHSAPPRRDAPASALA